MKTVLKYSELYNNVSEKKANFIFVLFFKLRSENCNSIRKCNSRLHSVIQYVIQYVVQQHYTFAAIK